MSVLLDEGTLQRYIEEVLKPAYQRKHAILMSAVRQFLLPLGVKIQGVGDDGLESKTSEDGKAVFGGYFIWLLLPTNISAIELSSLCLSQENLIIAPGHLFEVQGDATLQFQHEARLCFAWEKEGELREGVERMGKVLKRLVDGEYVGDEEKKGNGVDVGEFK